MGRFWQRGKQKGDNIRLMDPLARIAAIENVIIDPFFVADSQRQIIHFNRPFYSMLPRGVARGLKGKKVSEVIEFDIGGEVSCIVEHSWKHGGHLRLDEIPGRIHRTGKTLTFILSALPFFDEEGKPTAALVIQRNVTDEAQVQVKYQEMLDSARSEREQLAETIRARTRDLLETSQRLISCQRELIQFKRGRIV
ncbi:MAG: PAS domain-containing protein [Deltaproteobacteria bacterium]|nr:PAS domain-containing protein [Deltaproteobacteria bacterium]